MTKFYAGIGSRRTPPSVLKLLEDLAAELARDDWHCRTGAAEGADQACMRGAGRKCTPYLPWHDFNGAKGIALSAMNPDIVSAAYQIAAELHPNWAACSSAARKLHTRNVFQVLGPDLKTHSRFVLCWTPGGRLDGGTAMAIRIANKYGIPVRNLGSMLTLADARRWLADREDADDGQYEQREAAQQRLAAEFSSDYATQQALQLHDAC